MTGYWYPRWHPQARTKGSVFAAIDILAGLVNLTTQRAPFFRRHPAIFSHWFRLGFCHRLLLRLAVKFALLGLAPLFGALFGALLTAFRTFRTRFALFRALLIAVTASLRAGRSQQKDYAEACCPG